MINKLKTFAIAILVTGATVTATKAPASAPAAFTNTQIIQNVSIALTAYYEGIASASGKSLGDKTVTINTKDVLSVLSSVTGNSFPGTGAAAAKLVVRTAYDQSEIVASNEVVATNSITLSTTNGTTNLYLVTAATTNALSFETTNGSNFFTYYITNGSVWQITNALPVSTNAPSGTNSTFATLATNTILIGTTNITTNTAFTVDTNAAFWTTIVPSFSTNSGGITNVLIVTTEATNTSIPVFTNVTKSIGVLYGTDHTFVSVSNYLSESAVTNVNSAFNPVVEVETGTDLGATNATIATETKTQIKTYSIAAVGSSGTNNLVLDVQGIVASVLKYDTLSEHTTNASEIVKESTASSITWTSVTGTGFIGGTFGTNLIGTNYPGTNASTVLSNEVPYYGIVGTNTGVVYGGTNYGFLVNPTPVVIKGTITVTYLENLQ